MVLEGKNVVVTGASSGIGLELSKKLLESGCRVIGAARDTKKIKFEHENLMLYNCDISQKENVDQLFEYSQKVFGRIDLFIANAGFAYYEKIDQANWAHVRKIFDTNVLSLVYSAEKMKEVNNDKAYNFVAMASGMSYVSLPGYSLYSGTKAAIRGFADAYRWELDKKQYFQVAYPIATRTNFFNYAGNSPVPWPSQEVSKVARIIIKGIKRDKANIYPSKIFLLTKYLNNILPLIYKIYLKSMYRKFKSFIDKSYN